MDAHVAVLAMLTRAGVAFLIIWVWRGFYLGPQIPIPDRAAASMAGCASCMKGLLAWNRRSYEKKSRHFCRPDNHSQDLLYTLN